MYNDQVYVWYIVQWLKVSQSQTYSILDCLQCRTDKVYNFSFVIGHEEYDHHV